MTATAPRFSYRICSYVILPSLDGPRRRRAPRRERESLLQPLDFMGIHLVDILLRRFRQLARRIAGREEDDAVAGRHDRSGLVLDPDIPKIGRASCRDSVCQYESIPVVDGTFKKKNKTP